MGSQRFAVTKNDVFSHTKTAKRITWHGNDGVQRLEVFKVREYDEDIDQSNGILTPFEATLGAAQRLVTYASDYRGTSTKRKTGG